MVPVVRNIEKKVHEWLYNNYKQPDGLVAEVSGSDYYAIKKFFNGLMGASYQMTEKLGDNQPNFTMSFFGAQILVRLNDFIKVDGECVFFEEKEIMHVHTKERYFENFEFEHNFSGIKPTINDYTDCNITEIGFEVVKVFSDEISFMRESAKLRAQGVDNFLQIIYRNSPSIALPENNQYAYIFRNGVNDESIEDAGEFAKKVLKKKIDKIYKKALEDSRNRLIANNHFKYMKL